MNTKRVGFGLAALAAIGSGIWGCGKKQDSSEVEIALFQGGFGLDFFHTAAAEYEKKNAGVKIKLWGNPRVWEQLRPRFVAGTPPDLTWTGWGMDYWALVYEHQLEPLDAALDGPSADGKTKWRDTFDPTLLSLCQMDGKTYMLPYFVNVTGWWYDPKVFAKHGWTPPKTWSELLALCPKIKAAGMAPITYQGKYPYYMTTGFLFPWAVGAGGIKAFDDAQNLVPGAWKSAAFLKAATMIKQLKDAGFFQEGAIGMSHTESQMEFVSGRAAMIPCGTWLHSEEAKVMPKGAEMKFMLPPLVDGAVGDPTSVGIGIEPWAVPSKAKHKDEALGYYKYLTSIDKAKQFVEEKGTLTAIKGSDQVTLPDYLSDAAKAFGSSKTLWSVEYQHWYPKLEKETEDAMAALLSGQATPAEFCDRCEAAAEKQRQDKDTPKHTLALRK